MKNLNNLSDFETRELLNWFTHWMPMEKRREFVEKYPQHYKKVYGILPICVCCQAEHHVCSKCKGE